MRKIIGLIIIAVSVGFGLYLHDKYMKLLLEQELSVAPKPRYLEFINDQILPPVWPGDTVEVGGLSGLAWSDLNNTLYAVSDDRGGRAGPSRFYELRLSQSDEGKYSANIQAVLTIKTEAGKKFPDRSLDPEGISLDAAGWIYISSEGDFKKTKTAVPSILKLNASGVLQSRYDFPMPWFSPNPEDWDLNNGVRNNLSFESLDINPETGTLVTTTESALIQDGEKATNETGTRVRLSFNELTPEKGIIETAQHVYELSAIPDKSLNTQSVIGVTDLIGFKGKKLLVLERAYLAGRSKNRVKLFFADCSQATDVITLKSIREVDIEPCTKEMVYDFDNLIGSLSEEHPRVDNLEGMTLGPRAEDGRYLLILVSDNNFTSFQKTQFLYFYLKLPKGVSR